MDICLINNQFFSLLLLLVYSLLFLSFVIGIYFTRALFFFFCCCIGLDFNESHFFKKRIAIFFLQQIIKYHYPLLRSHKNNFQVSNPNDDRQTRVYVRLVSIVRFHRIISALFFFYVGECTYACVIVTNDQIMSASIPNVEIRRLCVKPLTG